MSKKVMRLLLVALLVLAVVAPVATAGAQTSGVSFACPAAVADPLFGFSGAGYAPGPTSFLLPQMANGGLDAQGRTVYDGSLNGFAVQVWVDSAWTAGSNVTLTNVAPPFGDYFCGGSGRDVVKGGAGNDSIHGWSGNDKLTGQAGFDFVYGGPGDDTVRGADDIDRLFGDDGNDTMYGNRGNDGMFGGPGNDNIRGGSDLDVLCGGGPWWGDSAVPYSGNCGVSNASSAATSGDPDSYDDGVDVLRGEGNNDRIIGGAGADTIKGGPGNDQLVGDWDASNIGGLQSAAIGAPAGWGVDTGVDFVADLFDGGDQIYCGSTPTNLDADAAFGGGGTDTSQNDCEASNAEIQLA